VRELVALLAELVDAGVILGYALFGALAQVRYTEPVATLDADVLVALPDPHRIDLLAPVYAFCRARGFEPEGDAIRVGAWPAQFVPVFSELTREALEEAETVDFEGAALRVVRATHLAAIALSVGRAKDHTRILALLDSEATTPEEIAALAARHGLEDRWAAFTRRFLDA
jgi:hypothetical protein